MATSTHSIQTEAHNSTPSAKPPIAPPPAERDEFDCKEFEGGRETPPYLQMLNHSDPNQAGFFITAENMEAVQFAPTTEWTPYTATFQSGETAAGYRSLIARFLILHRSRLLMFERESMFIGEYRKSQYDRTTMVLKTRYLVFIVGKDKQLLHQSPLLLTTKGSFCGSFGEVVRAFHSAMSKAYGAATGARKPRGDRFMALSILAVRVQPELKGTAKKSWVCSVSDYGIPTAENWKSYFVGYNPERKEKVLTAFEEWSEFGNLERECEAQVQRRQEPQDATIATDDSEDGYDISFAYEEL
jgi:hypothetical protein